MDIAYDEPNEETLAAINEVRSGKDKQVTGIVPLGSSTKQALFVEEPAKKTG